MQIDTFRVIAEKGDEIGFTDYYPASTIPLIKEDVIKAGHKVLKIDPHPHNGKWVAGGKVAVILSHSDNPTPENVRFNPALAEKIVNGEKITRKFLKEIKADFDRLPELRVEWVELGVPFTVVYEKIRKNPIIYKIN